MNSMEFANFKKCPFAKEIAPQQTVSEMGNTTEVAQWKTLRI